MATAESIASLMISGYPLTALLAVMSFSAMLVSAQIWMARPGAARSRRIAQRGQRAFAD